jgi:hypothetical protein
VPLHPSASRRFAPVVREQKGKVMTWAKKPPRERRVLFEIVKVRRNKPLYEQLSPAQQKNLTEFLRGVHGRLRL